MNAGVNSNQADRLDSCMQLSGGRLGVGASGVFRRFQHQGRIQPNANR
jgi:hypothetical protein